MTIAESDIEPIPPIEPHLLEEQQARQELAAILNSRPFRNSNQCSSLLRYVVEHTLSGDENLLRERAIGTDVFDRRTGYEPSEDPIVRTRASEVRKRLAQYYEAEGASSKLRIAIPTGSYRATFLVRSDSGDLPLILPPSLPSASSATPETQSGPADHTSKNRSKRRLVAALIVFVGCLELLAGAALFLHSRSALKQISRQTALWAPLTFSHVPITLCAADYTKEDLNQQGWADGVAAVIAGKSTTSRHPSGESLPLLPFVDAIAINKITFWLGSQGSSFVLQQSSQVTIDDLRRGPGVFVGAFDNDWSLVLLSKLRFHAQIDPSNHAEWIEDTHDPGSRKWTYSGDIPYSASSVDYAIISRVLDPSTGQWLLAIGGLGKHGTEAAADLLTEKQLANLLPEAVNESNKNIQMVVKTSVIKGHNSVPQIIASEVW